MKTSDYKTLLTSQPEPHILKIEMNRPEAANAFNTQMAYELTDLFEQLYLDAGDCRVVVLTATGRKAFCAGGDLKERNGMTDKAWEAQHLVYEPSVMAVPEGHSISSEGRSVLLLDSMLLLFVHVSPWRPTLPDTVPCVRWRSRRLVVREALPQPLGVSSCGFLCRRRSSHSRIFSRRLCHPHG